jgi:hypothetical protein
MTQRVRIGVYDHTGRLLPAVDALSKAGFLVDFIEPPLSALHAFDAALVHPGPYDMRAFYEYMRSCTKPLFMYDGSRAFPTTLAVDGVTLVGGELSELVNAVQQAFGERVQNR